MFRLVFKVVYFKLNENWLGFEAASHHEDWQILQPMIHVWYPPCWYGINYYNQKAIMNKKRHLKNQMGYVRHKIRHP